MKCTIFFLALALCTGGCVGNTYRLATVEVDPSRYEVLGESEGKATGIMLFSFIPIGQNEKLEVAVERMKKSLGGDEVVNLSVVESWFWAYILNGYKVHVSGTVLKEK